MQQTVLDLENERQEVKQVRRELQEARRKSELFEKLVDDIRRALHLNQSSDVGVIYDEVFKVLKWNLTNKTAVASLRENAIVIKDQLAQIKKSIQLMQTVDFDIATRQISRVFRKFNISTAGTTKQSGTEVIKYNQFVFVAKHLRIQLP